MKNGHVLRHHLAFLAEGARLREIREVSPTGMWNWDRTGI